MNRQAISGKVTLDGAPLDHGTIEFSPHRQQGGIGSGALIDNGRYAIHAKKGLPPGKYLVRLFSVEKPVDSFATEPGPGIGKPGKDRIPARYNVHSDIVVEVTDSGSNKFDFDVITPGGRD